MSPPMPVRAFDFHCHVDLHPSPPEFIASCQQRQIVTLAVTTTPKAWPQNRDWTRGNPYVHSAVGLHPELVAARYQEVDLLEQNMSESRLVGEIGLDGSPPHVDSLALQTEIFVRVLKRAEGLGGRVLSIHSRGAAAQVVRCIQEYTSARNVLAILHWFSGSPSVAREAAKLGCYFSLNHRTLQHATGIALVRALPEDRLLTETDAPFSSEGGRSASPPDVVGTAEKLAALKNLPSSDMRTLLRANAQRVLAFAGVELPGCEA